jgi:hypothetical protein
LEHGKAEPAMVLPFFVPTQHIVVSLFGQNHSTSAIFLENPKTKNIDNIFISAKIELAFGIWAIETLSRWEYRILRKLL